MAEKKKIVKDKVTTKNDDVIADEKKSDIFLRIELLIFCVLFWYQTSLSFYYFSKINGGGYPSKQYAFEDAGVFFVPMIICVFIVKKPLRFLLRCLLAFLLLLTFCSST
ncbi:MAG: hypothetical protein J6P93_02235 [Alphaproteobacteria bacterium]|nr:hypothetical protein [Alphaproteobacteria bacterium]